MAIDLNDTLQMMQVIDRAKAPASFLLDTSELQARDFRELQAMIVNRKNKMAAELLTSGEVTVSGFADDGKTAKEDKITFSGWTQEADASADWDSAGADILGDITEMSYAIQESSGMIPTVMICGKNIQEYSFIYYR